MRFQLSTMLLLFVTISVSICWLIDRARIERELSSSLECERLVAAISDLISRKNPAKEDPQELEMAINKMLISGLVEVFELSSQIDRLMARQGRNEKALYIGNDILSTIHCNSAEEYFDRLAELPGTREWFPEYLDINTDRHKKLREFVDDSLAFPRPTDSLLRDVGKMLEEAEHNAP